MTYRANQYTYRAATLEDLPRLSALDAAHTRHATGKAQRTENEIAIEWKAPYFDLSRDSQVAVMPDGAIVGWVELYDMPPHVRMPTRLRVAPEISREPITATLIQWCKERARASLRKAPAGARITLTQSAYSADQTLLDGLKQEGFTYVRSFHRMRIDLEHESAVPVWPEGVLVRPFVKGQDDRPAVEAIREFFQDHWGYVETPLEEDLEEWRQWIYEDEDFDTDLWFLAIADDQIVGLCQCYPRCGEDTATALVDELGVRKDWRRRGLGMALLLHAFDAFSQRGFTGAELGVDSESLTGATRVYERAGMSRLWENRVHELEIRPGEEQATTDA